MVPDQRLELRFMVPKTTVLPLDESGAQGPELIAQVPQIRLVTQRAVRCCYALGTQVILISRIRLVLAALNYQILQSPTAKGP